MSTITISGGGVSPLVLYGDCGEHETILREYDGWYDSPDCKADLTERSGGDGAYDIPESRILYAARTVTIRYRLLPLGARDRSRLRALQEQVNALLHRQVTVRVQDADRDLFAVGYVDSIDVETTVDNVNREYLNGQLNVVCPRPELRAMSTQSEQIRSDGNVRGGLQYGPGYYTYWEGTPNDSVSVLVTDTNYGHTGLHYPLTYGTRYDGRNICALHNRGDSRAYPVFTLTGRFADGVDLKLVTRDGSSHLTIGQPVDATTPIILDTRSQSVTRAGSDMSGLLSSRGWATIPAGTSMSVALMCAADGWVTCETHDTYM